MILKPHSWWQKIRSVPYWLWKKIRKHPRRSVGITAVIIAFFLAVYVFGWDWTGINAYSVIWTVTTPSGTTLVKVDEQQPAKTFWDLLQLAGIVAIPVVVGLGVSYFTTKQAQESEETSSKQRETELEIATDNQRESALQGYIDKMSELLLKEHLWRSNEGDEVRKIARVRTLTVLPRLDAIRKRSVLEFLQESSLIDKVGRIVDLGKAFLNGADLFEIDLSSTDLSRANLNRADLRGGNLRDTELTNADLTGTLLTGATLTEATLTEAYLIGATLQGANLTKATLTEAYLIGATLQGANLTKANLTKAYLRGVNLTDADLTDADLTDADLTDAILTGATITKEQWEKAKLLQGATLPDGSKHS